MANAQTLAPESAPLKKKDGPKEIAALAQEFDPNKKYMFQLATELPPREIPVYEVREAKAYPAPHQKFQRFRNMVFTSQIIWNGQRRMLRYYDGCDSIFVDEQPKERESIEDFIKHTQPRNFIQGKFGCNGDERMLLLYLFICSWNVESEFRTRTANGIFRPMNADKIAMLETSKLDQIELALKYAKEATETKMLIHANFLGIATTDWESGNDLTPVQIRAAYRKEAIEHFERFIESYGNRSIEIKYYIDKAIKKGLIHNQFNKNKASWAKSNTEICDISGIVSHTGIAEKLFEFSQLSEGEEFVIQLRALFEK